MTSKQVLILHSIIFFGFALGAASSPFLSVYFPEFFSSGFFLPSAVAVMVLTVASWRVFGGCPFTVWENRRLSLENKPGYQGSCIPHYAHNWLGLNFPPVVYSVILLTLLCLPIGVGIFLRFL